MTNARRIGAALTATPNYAEMVADDGYHTAALSLQALPHLVQALEYYARGADGKIAHEALTKEL